MTTYSPRLQLWEGTPGDPAIRNSWGTSNNTNFTLLDDSITGSATVNLAGLTTYTLTTANGAADEARAAIYNFGGALSADCTVTLPNTEKIGWAVNHTTGSHNVILTNGGGRTLTLPSTGYWFLYYSDGTNVDGVSIQSPSLVSSGVLSVLSGGAAIQGNSTVAGTLGVSGALTISSGGASITGGVTTSTTVTTGGKITVNSGGQDINGNLGVVGNATVLGTFTATLSQGSMVFAGNTLAVTSTAGTAATFYSSPGVASTVVNIRTDRTDTPLLYMQYGVTPVGSITTNGIAVTYNTTSDYRVKITYGPAVSEGLIDAIPVHEASFRLAPEYHRPMFLAHEVQATAPWAVMGEKDDVDDEGGIIPQQLDLMALIPTLWAEVQSLRKRVKALGG